jgi:hypothetical protein
MNIGKLFGGHHPRILDRYGGSGPSAKKLAAVPASISKGNKTIGEYDAEISTGLGCAFV